MGRHSAPDDDEDVAPGRASTAVLTPHPTPIPSGRHSVADQAPAVVAAVSATQIEAELVQAVAGVVSAAAQMVDEVYGSQPAPDRGSGTDTIDAETVPDTDTDIGAEPDIGIEPDFAAEVGTESDMAGEAGSGAEPIAAQLVETAADESGLAKQAAAATTSARESDWRADARLLRASRALQLACFVALVVPFALYTVAMLVLGRGDQYLLWIWVPTILAGILVGASIDVGHKRAVRSAV